MLKPTRIWVVANNVFWETIRDRVLYLVGLFLGLDLLAMILIPQVAAATEDKILKDLGLAAIAVMGLVVAIFVGTSLINKEIEKRTVFVLLAKPVSRSEFLIGKHLGLTGVIAVLLALMTLIYGGLLALYGIPFPLDSTLIAIGFMLLELSLIVAVAVLFGVFTSSLLATLLTLAVYLMGHLSQDLVELGKLSENPRLQQIIDGLYLILPDLSRIDLKNQAVYGMALIPPPAELALNLLYGVVYIVLLLAIASLIFSRRQF